MLGVVSFKKKKTGDKANVQSLFKKTPHSYQRSVMYYCITTCKVSCLSVFSVYQNKSSLSKENQNEKENDNKKCGVFNNQTVYSSTRLAPLWSTTCN